MWYANFYYTDWTGEKKHICKRGFSTQREAKEYERTFMDHCSLSREDLANISNMTTSNCIRTLSAFVSEGLIETNVRKIKILNEEEIKKIAKG